MIDQSYRNRKCTDIFCTVLFLCVFGIVGFFGYINLQNLKEFNLLDMYDKFGNVCGKGLAKDFPLLHLKFEFKVENPFHNRHCIKSCPHEAK